MSSTLDAYRISSGDISTFMQRSDAAKFLAQPLAYADWIDWTNHSSALFLTGQTKEALVAAGRALALNRTSSTLLNFAVILETMSRFEEAFPFERDAYQLDKKDPFATTLYSDACLRFGKLFAAWPIYSQSHANYKWLSNVIPEWDGKSSLDGKRLLVLSGGGFGDNILFLRWMPKLKALGPFITYMCPSSFSPMLSRFPSVDRFIAGSVSGLDGMLMVADYDCYTCILSLGEYFCPSMADIPTTPYIIPDLALSWVHRGPKRLVGLCTHAGEEKFPRRHRSLSTEQMIPLLKAIHDSGADSVSLNYDCPLPCTFPTILHNWAETASIIANLDLVVTVDTGIAHLAGALGIPAYVILPGMSASYYGINGHQCAFYPTHRLFRNGGEGIDISIRNACAAITSC